MKKLIMEELNNNNGFARFYEKDGWNTVEVMEIMDLFLDKDAYSYGLIENRSGLFVEVTRMEEE
jgi:hypothetical protein